MQRLLIACRGNKDELDRLFEEQIDKAHIVGVILQPISFEVFIGSLELVCKGEYLLGLLDEFKIYHYRNNHLPNWKYLLDVVNCKGTINEVDNGVYICPDIGGNYNHRRAKYFGPYINKG